jgi:glucokinase
MTYIGIDIGGTKTAGGIVTEDGAVITRLSLSTPVKDGGQAILDNAIEVAKRLIEQSKQRVEGIGVGTGGQIDSDSGVVFSATAVLPGYCGLKISEGFSNALGVSTKTDNDVNVLALAEYRFGAARKLSKGTVIFLALGTGVGGAILIDGKLHYGRTWTGGELGHIIIDISQNARKDLGGAKGTLEAYCSGSGLVNTYCELTGQKNNNLTGEDIATEAQKDPNDNAVKAITKTGEYLGYGLASLANTFDPDLFVIGGGLAALGDRLLGPAIKVLKENAMPGPGTCPVVLAELGNDAAIVGAASLVIPNKARLAL